MAHKILMLKGDMSGYELPFTEWGTITHNIDDIADCDVVVFTGGSDVSPELYGEVALPSTHFDYGRDRKEMTVFNMALLLAIPMVGICRGAQFLTVMNGGALIQHAEGHRGTNHSITLRDGTSVDVSSDHHQMMVPKGDYELLGWSKQLSTVHQTEMPETLTAFKAAFTKGNELVEPEIIYWPRTTCLGVQYHPEWMDEHSHGYRLFQQLLDDYIM